MKIVSKTATTALNKVKLAEAEIKKFHSIPPDDDVDSDVDLSSSHARSTSSTSSSHHSDAGEDFGMPDIEDEALETKGLNSEEESKPDYADSFSIPPDDDDPNDDLSSLH